MGDEQSDAAFADRAKALMDRAQEVGDDDHARIVQMLEIATGQYLDRYLVGHPVDLSPEAADRLRSFFESMESVGVNRIAFADRFAVEQVATNTDNDTARRIDALIRNQQ